MNTSLNRQFRYIYIYQSIGFDSPGHFRLVNQMFGVFTVEFIFYIFYFSRFSFPDNFYIIFPIIGLSHCIAQLGHPRTDPLTREVTLMKFWSCESI